MNEILTAAADLIEQDGWCQGSLQNDRGQHCIMGAISYAAADYSVPEYHAAVDAVVETVDAYSVVRWNDQPGRTQAEVVAALRKAAQS